jgi:hypothetical protein
MTSEGNLEPNSLQDKKLILSLKQRSRKKQHQVFHKKDRLNEICFLSSLVLNVGANNATCRLFKDFATPGKTTPQKLFFVHVNVDTLFADTSIETLHQNGKLKSGGPEDGKHAIVHYRFGQTLLFVENEIKWNLIFGFLHKIRIETFAYVGS